MFWNNRTYSNKNGTTLDEYFKTDYLFYFQKINMKIKWDSWSSLKLDKVGNRLNPLVPSVPYMTRLAKILIFNLRRDHKKNPMSVATMSR